MAVLTDKQLAAQIRNWRKKNIVGPAYGIRTDQEFRGGARLEVDGQAYAVAECHSDLEARDLLGQRLSGDDGLVLLFRVGHDQLGEDLLARLAKERLLSVDARQSLRELFQAASIDPRILMNPKLVDALVTAAAERGGVISSVGVLDMDLAWSVLLANPEMVHRRPDLVTLLCWSLDDDQWQRVRALEPEVRRAFFAWVGDRAGEAAGFMDAAELGGHAETLVPIGLALGVLFADGGGRDAGASERLEGRVRIEDYLGKQKIGPGPAMAWHLAAVSVTRDLPASQRFEVAKRLDHLLKAVKIEGLAVESDFSALGFSERVKVFAESLQRYGRRKAGLAGAELGACFQALGRHVLAGDPRHRERLPRAEMAIRLAIWLKRPGLEEEGNDGFLSLEAAMEGYLREVSFVDRARFALTGGDAAEPELSQAYHVLARQAAKLRQGQQRRFGDLLASWNEGNSQGQLLRVEDVLDAVVVPLVQERPVLLLVLDGMSVPVFQEFVEDFSRREWLPTAREGQSPMRAVVSALPSVTNISRQALFSGRLDVSDKRGEAIAFRDHRELVNVGKKTRPQLFLKGDLTNPGQTFLNEAVREAIASPAQRVVAVLLNVVDDQLSAADQLEVCWRIDRIRFLEPILEAAVQADRLIVLTSDHGHVPDLNQTAKATGSADGGDRYRGADGPPAGTGELLVRGERITAATGKAAVILACEETVRYANKRAGYHGGASDLEVVIPLTVLDARSETPEGWVSQDPPAPAWWRWQEVLGEAPPNEPVRVAPLRRPRRKGGSQEASLDDLPLFVDVVAPGPGNWAGAASAWIEALAASAVFQQQAQSMGKLAPRVEQVSSFLAAMEKRGNSVLLATLASDLGMPAFRLRGLLSLLGRFFNVDGYPVVEEDRASETVRLDRKLLAQQFEIAA